MSSCPKKSNAEIEESFKAERMVEIHDKASKFLKGVVLEMCMLEGTGGNIDSAFKINRQPIIAKVLREIAKELEESNEQS